VEEPPKPEFKSGKLEFDFKPSVGVQQIIESRQQQEEEEQEGPEEKEEEEVVNETSNLTDFNYSIQQMVKELDLSKAVDADGELGDKMFHTFPKIEYLDFKTIFTKSGLVSKNKLSGKLDRRCIQYYDLYAK
jgi:soluble cytochrome b562